MHLALSCIATSELSHCTTPTYIHFNDEARARAESSYRRLPMLLSLIRMIQAFRDYQRNVAELSQLSDRELADIGLDRSDIPRVAAGQYQG
ncbi:hypothetical protein BJS_03181 [Bradyrhizobium japonicum SEMIA 5079]|nr:hypothetical protein BJS_03181 [Bradyrhizobium japonicum SEMIA 5079]